MQGFSQAAENNKGPILEILRDLVPERGSLLEIGSGTGQHALFMGHALPEVRWQPSDVAANLPALAANLDAAPPNVQPPVALDLNDPDWPVDTVDVVYAANVLHIVSMDLGAALIAGAGSRLAPGGRLILYGPFRYDGEFTTESNRDFDGWLRERDSASGIREIAWVESLADEAGLSREFDRSMPANNQLLSFVKRLAS